MSTAMFELHHTHSYHAKEEIKKLGGNWNPQRRSWFLPTKEALQAALDACDLFAPQPYQVGDSDAVENVVGWKAVRNSIGKTPIPLKENAGKEVKSGLAFSGLGHSASDRMNHLWIATARLPDFPLADSDQFLCVNLDGKCRVSNETKKPVSGRSPLPANTGSLSKDR